MIYHLSDDLPPRWHCPTCEVGWASTWVHQCWCCHRRGAPGDIRKWLVWRVAA